MLPPVRVHHPHIVVRPDVLAGSPIVEGTRVPVRRIWLWHRKGVTVATLCKRYAALSPAQILSALSFAYDNEELIEADLERERVMLEAEGPSR